MIESGDIIELRIVQMLESENRWWKSEELAETLSLSKATVQKYLVSLKEKVGEFQQNEIFLQTSTSKGIYFYRSPSFNLQLLYVKIIKNLLTYSIIDGLLYNEHFSINKLAQKNYVSVASIRRKYKMINNYFNDLDLMIKKDKILGDERQIRWFFSEFYWEVYMGTEWPFQLIPKSFVENVLATIENFFEIKVIPEVREKLMYWLTVNGLRHVRGYRVDSDSEIVKYAESSPLFKPFVQILSELFPSEAQVADDRGLGEMQYLFFIANALPVLEKHIGHSEAVYIAHKTGETKIYSATRDWLTLYEKDFHYHFSDNERCFFMQNLLRIHSYSYLYKLGGPIYEKESYVQEVVANHPIYFDKLSKLYEQLLVIYPQIMKNKDYLIESYALLVLQKFKIDIFEKVIRISLSFSEGLIYEEVVKKKLLHHFKEKFKLKFVTHTEDKDLIITNQPHIGYAEKHLVASVNTYLTNRDYQNIEKVITDIKNNDYV